ncbi:hypothetical protein Cgig2_030964 [Carnegiea gigantea]|uniref:PB1-like domain-containing protein n=1 Tax=Carnegiea gigantea TaxID=171969 RepID=A0A9Q1QBW9_9CARY|nr:hypothetical protein Cgig2_030964 [Carnegiea gigantea]
MVIVLKKFLILCVVGGDERVECDIDNLNVANILGIVIELEYTERRIKKICFSKLELPFEDSLVSIENDEKVYKLIALCKSSEYVCLYVEHNNEVNFVECGTNDNEFDDGSHDYMDDDEYDEYGSDIEDEKFAQIKREKKMYHEMVADLDGLRAENRKNWEESNTLDDIYGLLSAISKLLPRAEHQLCARRVYANLRKNWKSLQYRDIFCRITKSSNGVDYNKHIKEMREARRRMKAFGGIYASNDLNYHACMKSLSLGQVEYLPYTLKVASNELFNASSGGIMSISTTSTVLFVVVKFLKIERASHLEKKKMKE